MSTSRPPLLSRRAVLAMVALSPVAVAACSAEPEPEVPDQRPEPTSTPEPDESGTQLVPDEAFLVEAWLTAELRADQARQLPPGAGAVGEAVAIVLGEQARVLRELLEAGGVSLPVPEPYPGAATSAPTAAPTSQPETTAQPDTATSTAGPGASEVHALAVALASDAGPAGLDSLARVSEVNLTMVLSMTGARAGWAGLLGEAVPRPELLGGPTAAAVVDALGPVREAAYLAQVLAARTSAEEWSQAYDDLFSRLQRLEGQLLDLAGGAAPPRPLGYRLPELESPAQRNEAMATTLEAIVPALLTGSEALTADSEAIGGTVWMIGEVIAMGERWQVAQTPFPGMAQPG